MQPIEQPNGNDTIHANISTEMKQSVRDWCNRNDLKDARWRRFQKVLVWSVDRLGRSLKNLVDTLTELRDLKIDIFAQQQGIDTGTQMGAMMFSFISIFSEFETNLRKSRQQAGIIRAKAAGKTWGGRQPTSEEKLEKIRTMKRKGFTVREICKKLKVSPNTIYAAMG